MKIQRIKIAKATSKKEQSWRANTTWFQALLQSSVTRKYSVGVTQTNRSKEQRESTRSRPTFIWEREFFHKGVNATGAEE